MIRLVYQRGEFDASQTELVATALFWFAFSLPFNGLFLLLTRTFFSLQRPWLPTAISLAQPRRSRRASPFALYGEFEVAGIVAATAIATAASVVAQAIVLRRQLGGLELAAAALDRRSGSASPRRPSPASLRHLVRSSTRRSAAASAARSSRWASALAAGAAVYAAAVSLLRVPEAPRSAPDPGRG